ncbi:hypothetical protein MKX03_036290 [Papaver bracteatum]|nr:hypothetical protein MKX03_036290 [Papaver bracteatum]
MASSRVLILLALCVLPALLVEAAPLKEPYQVTGRVYCDTCHLGCEHKLVTYIAGVIVKIECKDDKNYNIKYSREEEDHQEDFCFAVLVSSPQTNCNKIVPGLDRVTAIVTNNNGLQETSPKRNVNSLGFKKDSKVSGCAVLFSSTTLISRGSITYTHFTSTFSYSWG